MGMALRVRWASGWWSFVCELDCWKPAGVYGFGAEERTKEGVGCNWCWRGDWLGEPLDSDERSEPEEWMDWSCSLTVSACYGDRRHRLVAKAEARATYIILGEQVEGAEHLVVLNVKGPRGLEVALEGEHRGRLDGELFRGADLSDLAVVLRCRDPRRPPRSAAVVVVGVSVHVLRLTLAGVVEEVRHGGGLWCEASS